MDSPKEVPTVSQWPFLPVKGAQTDLGYAVREHGNGAVTDTGVLTYGDQCSGGLTGCQGQADSLPWPS